MSTVLTQPLIERFREPDAPYLSPTRVGEFFGFGMHELAERAHVHRNVPTARPQAPRLQKYLQDLLRLFTLATAVTQDAERAVFLLRNAPLKAFGYKTADLLVQEGRADDVIAYLESLAGGAAG